MKTSNLAISASYFHKDPPLRSAVRLMEVGFKRLEFDGQELKDLSVSEFKELSLTLEGAEVACSAVNVVGDLMPISLGNLAAFGNRERRNAVAHVKACIDLAVRLKCGRVVCDLGSSTEDLFSFEKQNDQLASSIEEILSDTGGVSVVLLNVPGRRWLAWNGLPPDPSRVVERYVWPWRMWFDEEKLVADISTRLATMVRWAFDCANEVVAHGSNKFRLEDAVIPYLDQGLEMVYLANHSGPYNRVWHRSLLHQSLSDGFFTSQDYAALFSLLGKRNFAGEVCLKISEKNPSESLLQRNLKLIEQWRVIRAG